MPRLPRVQQIALPILRAALPGVKCGSWVEDIDYRTFPLVNVRRIGGTRNGNQPDKFGLPVVEMTVYGTAGLVETENLYEDALEALYEAVRLQTQTAHGYLHSIKETMGATQFPSPFQDSWRIQGLIRLGVRPPRTTA
ncbi:MAG: hypothetical protein ACXVBB_09065 [Isosphaeraceae bacterium]